MQKDGKISTEEYTISKDKKIELKLNKDKINKLNSYSESAINEAEKILGIPARQIALSGYKIYTYQDEEKQNALEEAIKSQNVNCDSAGIVIDNEGRTVTVDGKLVELSFREYELLKYLIDNVGIALSRDKILNNVWNYDYYGDSRTIDSHIKKIRHKLGKKGKYIETMRGVGYKFEGKKMDIFPE